MLSLYLTNNVFLTPLLPPQVSEMQSQSYHVVPTIKSMYDEVGKVLLKCRHSQFVHVSINPQVHGEGQSRKYLINPRRMRRGVTVVVLCVCV